MTGKPSFPSFSIARRRITPVVVSSFPPPIPPPPFLASVPRPTRSFGAAGRGSPVESGLQDASRTDAPASFSVRARTPVFASVWSAIPIFRPLRAFDFTSSARTAARTGMWVRAHSRRRAPRSASSDTDAPNAPARNEGSRAPGRDSLLLPPADLVPREEPGGTRHEDDHQDRVGPGDALDRRPTPLLRDHGRGQRGRERAVGGGGPGRGGKLPAHARGRQQDRDGRARHGRPGRVQ